MTDIYKNEIVPSLRDLGEDVRWIRSHMEKEIANLRQQIEDLKLLADLHSKEEWEKLQQENDEMKRQLRAIAGEPRSPKAPDIDIDNLSPEDLD